MKDESINKKIDEVLNSIDGIEQASPKPFLFTRLEARMLKEKNVWEKLSSFVARPVIAFACICIVIMINVWVIFSSGNSNNNIPLNNEFAAADEYSQVTTTFYDFENNKP